jgi:hypothetical protein
MLLGLATFVWGAQQVPQGDRAPAVGGRRHHAASQQAADFTAGDVAQGALAQAEMAAATQAASPVPGIVAGLVGAVLGYLAGGTLGLFMGGIILWALATTVLGTRGEERNRVLAIFMVVFFVIFFWAAYEQAGSSMNLFADKNTDRTAPGWLRSVAQGELIPASWFQSVNPAVLLLSAPFFAHALAGARPRRPRAVDGHEDGGRPRAPRRRLRLHGGGRARHRGGRTGEPVVADRRVRVPHLGRAVPVARRDSATSPRWRPCSSRRS